MTAPEKLSSLQMAQFAARGFLRLDAVVPERINQVVLETMDAALTAKDLPGTAQNDPKLVYAALIQRQVLPLVAPGSPWQSAYPEQLALGRLLRLPVIQGAIESLVGEQAVVDHQFLHVTFPPRPGHSETAQHYHQDSTIDLRKSFDVQLMYFPHAVTLDMGGTRFLPGSHLRIVSESAIARYQNLRGQEHMVCPAGTVLVVHHGIWHGGGANRSNQRRYMWKLRLCPQEPQVRLWNTADLPVDHNKQRPIFWQGPASMRDPIHTILTTAEPWFEADTERLEFINRVRFWRRLLGDNQFDADYWQGRLDNEFQ